MPGGATAPVHPNDDVNRSQSSNDVIPTAIHLSAAIALSEALLPALKELIETLGRKAGDVGRRRQDRPHAPDGRDAAHARPGDGCVARAARGRDHAPAGLSAAAARTGAGGHSRGHRYQRNPLFAAKVAAHLSQHTGLDLRPARDFFAALASQDTAVELSGHLRTLAVR
jgi:fumarate hydratase, class II